jgi:hypothetical protein
MATYSDPGSLDEIALRAGADIRSPLLRTLVELYVQKPIHTAEEAQHFTELMLRLLDQVDVATRAGIAHRLSSYPAVPDAITQRLTHDVPDVAALVRPLSESAYPKGGLVQAPVSLSELSELFFAARSAERRLILMNIGYAVEPHTAAFSGDAPAAAREFEAAALARKPEAVMRGIEQWFGLKPTLSRRIVTDPLGEPIVVVAKVVGMAPSAVQRILLFINPVIGRSVSRVYELATLFQEIDTPAAHALIRIWRAADPRAARKSPASAEAESVGRSVRGRAAGATRSEQRGEASPSRPAASRKG